MNRLIKHIGFCAAMLAGSTAVAGITFYEAENFGGRQIGGSEAMPNFRALDFNDRARSAIVDGGSWEVCVGTNFDNKCTVLAPGRYPNLGEWSRTISSARPVSWPQANLQPPGVVSTLPGRVTFYESENFGGRQIGGSEAMPNFRTLDFNDRARSAIIDGGPWELCVGTNFGNDCTVLGPGRYPTLGEWSRRINSARPASSPQAYVQSPAVVSPLPGQVTFYESDNFGGRHFAIQQPLSRFDGMRGNDWPQSAIVEGGAWEICVDADFHGDCRVFVPGRYPTLGGLGGRVRSARPANDPGSEPPRGWMGASASATLYSGQNLTGRAFALGSQGSGNLDGLFNDRATSLRVERGYWIFCSDANFQGECRTFGPGEYPRLPPELDNRISSGRRISNNYPYADQPSWR